MCPQQYRLLCAHALMVSLIAGQSSFLGMLPACIHDMVAESGLLTLCSTAHAE